MNGVYYKFHTDTVYQTVWFSQYNEDVIINASGTQVFGYNAYN
jgi:hypothetical protein